MLFVDCERDTDEMNDTCIDVKSCSRGSDISWRCVVVLCPKKLSSMRDKCLGIGMSIAPRRARVFILRLVN